MKSLLARHALALLMMAFMAPGAHGEDGQPEPGPPSEAMGVPLPAPAADTPGDGDVITLTTGREIRGFRVLSQTPTEVVLLLSDGIELRLPRNMVASIELERRRGERAPENGAESALARELKGVKIAPVLNRRLQGPVEATEPREIRNADFVDEIIALSQQVEVPLTIAPTVRAYPAQDRQWTTTIVPGSSFFSILHDDLLSKFSYLAVDYRYNELILTTREAMEAQTAESDGVADSDNSSDTPNVPPTPAE